MPSCKLTKRVIDALPSPSAADSIWWDQELKGFGVKVTPAGRKVFLVQYRPAGDRGNPRKYTIGEHGPVTPHQARIEAQRVLADRAAGRDPQHEKQLTRRRLASDGVPELVAEFLARHSAQNRTAAETARIFNREVLPVWNGRRIGEVSKRDIIALLDRIASAARPSWQTASSPPFGSSSIGASREAFSSARHVKGFQHRLEKRRAIARSVTRNWERCSRRRGTSAIHSARSCGFWCSPANGGTRSVAWHGTMSISAGMSGSSPPSMRRIASPIQCT